MEKDSILIYCLTALAGAYTIGLIVMLICFCRGRCKYISNKVESDQHNRQEGTPTNKSHEKGAETSRSLVEVTTEEQTTGYAMKPSKRKKSRHDNRKTETQEKETISKRLKKTEDELRKEKEEKESIIKLLRKTEDELGKEKEEKESIIKLFNEKEHSGHTCRSEMTRLEEKLRNETAEKDNALKRLSALMSGRIKDGNPNVVDLTDQNRPTRVGEQFSELYDNQWTDAYGAIENFFGHTKANSEIIQILLDILEQCFSECKIRSNGQLQQLNETVSQIATRVSKRPDVLSADLMQRIKEDRKLFGLEDVPKINEILPFLKNYFSLNFLDTSFLDAQLLQMFVQKCVEITWFMVIKDPPMTIVIKPQPDSYGNFKAYQTRGKEIKYVVWPSLHLEEGGSLVAKGVAEFIKSEKVNE